MSISPKIVCLSNVYDSHYHQLRQEKVPRCLSQNKRRDLFLALEKAVRRPLIVLSAPPHPLERPRQRHLPPCETQFGKHQQFFCGGIQIPKIRIPLSWLFYAVHALRHVRSGDMVLIDNYELIYIFAARWVNLFRRVDFVLDYEDGKHVIDHSWPRVLSATAEFLGRSLFRAALVAHPRLATRLPSAVPWALCPGFLAVSDPGREWESGQEVQLLYSGSLDTARGVDLLLESLPLLPASGWKLHIAGAGSLQGKVEEISRSVRWAGRVIFHQTLDGDGPEFKKLIASCQVGLNCQRMGSPISDVTFPSKIFTYLSSQLLVISSRASEVPEICQQACLYYDEDQPENLARLISEVVANFPLAKSRVDAAFVAEKYSHERTVRRLEKLLSFLKA